MSQPTLPIPPSADDGISQGIGLALGLVEKEFDRLGLFQQGLKVDIDVKALYENNSPPRIVWIPSDDQFGPRGAQTGNPAAVATCFAGVRAHIWGKDRLAAEQLRLLTVGTIIAVALGSIQHGVNGFHGHWLTQEERVAGWSRLGEIYVLSFALAIPVLKPALETFTVKNFATEQLGTPGDGVLQCGEE